MIDVTEDTLANAWPRERPPCRVAPLQIDPACIKGAVHATETGGGAAAAPADGLIATPSSLVTLLTRHILRDGELVILILKPSYWFIVLQSLRVIAAVLIVMIAAKVYQHDLPLHAPVRVASIGLVAIAARLMWSAMQWTNRFYILTDLRIIRLAGVFAVDIFDCPLRKIARLRRVTTIRERMLGLGSIEIIPLDDQLPIGQWQTVARPRQVYAEILAAMRRAKGS